MFLLVLWDKPACSLSIAGIIAAMLALSLEKKVVAVLYLCHRILV